MIGKFYPAQVYGTARATTVSPVSVRSVDAASELLNDIKWLVFN